MRTRHFLFSFFNGSHLLYCTCLLVSKNAFAEGIELFTLDKKTVNLEVTETAVIQQRFDARDPLSPRDYGWGSVQNKLNAQASWSAWNAGLRLDAAAYWLRPEDRAFCATCTFTPAMKSGVESDGASRFRNSIYPAKLWVHYKKSGLDLTFGDAYMQLGKGLSLSLRKLDELGVDTSLRGVKVSYQKDPYGFQLAFGLANPNRVDEASGRTLFLRRSEMNGAEVLEPMFGSDRILAGEVTMGRGKALSAATRAVHIQRCSPYTFDARGTLQDSLLPAPLGSCDARDQSLWLSSLPSGLNPLLRASSINVIGQSLEVPNLFEHGQLYVEGALSSANFAGEDASKREEGNALYASLVTYVGKVTNTLEVKSYRHFYPIPAAVNASRATEFSPLAYSQAPTTETLIQDSMFGFFNACVNGGKLRSDVKLSPSVLVYGTLGYWNSKSEQTGSSCDKYGKWNSSSDPIKGQNNIWDILIGTESRFDNDRSQLLASLGARDDRRGDGEIYYRELSANYTIHWHLKKEYSIELTGRHRVRFQEGENLQGDALSSASAWFQGFHTTAFKIAPKWVFSQGIEYLTLAGQPSYYLNASVLYKFTSDSNLRVFAGQQQGGLRCVSGVCRIFPAYEGVRAELTLRF